MYISSCSIRSWNWNRKLTQDHFLIEHWIQRTHRCPAVRYWPWVYSLGMASRYSTVRSGTLTWREWGLWARPSSRVIAGSRIRSIRHDKSTPNLRTRKFHQIREHKAAATCGTLEQQQCVSSSSHQLTRPDPTLVQQQHQSRRPDNRLHTGCPRQAAASLTQ